MAKNKAQIDVTGDNEQLDEALKNSESLISAFGRKITSIFSGISNVTNNVRTTIISAFNSSSQAVQDFTDSVQESSLAVNLFNSLWNKSKLLLLNFSNQLQDVIARHRILALTNRLVGYASGYATEQLKKYAEYLEKVTRFSASVTESAQNLIMHFRNIHGDEFLSATRLAQDLAQTLRIDLNSAAQLVAESLHDPIDAISKLASVNVFFTEGEKKAIQKLTDANKILAAQQIILGKLESAFGGAAKAAGETFYGRLDRLRNILTTIGTTITEKVIGKLNQLFDKTVHGRKAFDVLLQKVDEFGRVAVAAVDIILPKIINLVSTIQIDFSEIYSWLIEQTVNTFSAMQIVFSQTAEVFSNINSFIFSSFTQIWNGISKIFTDIIPKAYNYMAQVFNNLTLQIIQNWKIFWHNANVSGQQYLNDFYGFMVKLGIKIVKWGANIAMIPIRIALPFKWMISALFGDVEQKLDDFVDKYTQETDKILKKSKIAYKFANPFTDIEAPDFSNTINDLKETFDLTDKWGGLLNDLSNNFGDTFQENVGNNKKAFKEFVDDVKKRSKEIGDIFKPPEMIANERLKDERKESMKGKGKGASFEGAEELWNRISTSKSDEIKDRKESLKTQKQIHQTLLKQYHEGKKQELKDIREKGEKARLAKRLEDQEKRHALNPWGGFNAGIGAPSGGI